MSFFIDVCCYNYPMNGKRIKDIEKHSDKWIALDVSRTKIISSGREFQKVYDEANKMVEKPLLMKVPRLDASFSP